MNARFALTGLLTTLVHFVLHALAYFLVLRQVFAAHPGGTEALQRQLVKGADHMVLWALALSALAFGYLITTAVRWSGASSWASGLKTGAIVGTLLWAGVNFGLYSSSNHFSLVGTLADLVSSALCMALSAGFAARLLHSGRARGEPQPASSGRASA
ncbi:MAG: hypothetical protein L6Q84_17900 [Polyangiaceae bacterium]|nr:hypothetical protein [Polyangiaceae bacterium]